MLVLLFLIGNSHRVQKFHFTAVANPDVKPEPIVKESNRHALAKAVVQKMPLKSNRFVKKVNLFSSMYLFISFKKTNVFQ